MMTKKKSAKVKITATLPSSLYEAFKATAKEQGFKTLSAAMREAVASFLESYNRNCPVDPKDTTPFSEKLKDWRDLHQLNAKQASNIIGGSHRTLERWISGRNEPTPQLQRMILNIMRAYTAKQSKT